MAINGGRAELIAELAEFSLERDRPLTPFFAGRRENLRLASDTLQKVLKMVAEGAPAPAG